MEGNRLANETSPYLLQHQDNPVHWYPWGDDALKAAKEQGKPILLSVGYAACHWCHVMAHESFEDDETAALMNSLFINIKVDREERPDIDSIYQASLALMGQQGGWPLTIFLTPEGKPFWGGTYFPPQDRYGQPAFRTILGQLHQTWEQNREKVTENVKALDDALQRLSRSSPGHDITPDRIRSVSRSLARRIDPFFGGIGEAPKFPTPTAISLIWNTWLETGDKPFEGLALTTLNGMCEGGIYDHLRGGFARYSTDDEWLAPHFEKMLYDNAQLIELLCLIWRNTGSELYRQRVSETMDWISAEMLVPGGGFASTLDADSEGEEGKFYVWSDSEVIEALKDLPEQQITEFLELYDVKPGGNWEKKVILNRRNNHGPFSDAVEQRLAECRALLLKHRNERVRPGWDDKVLADWNGMMIAAAAIAGATMDRSDWITMARDAFSFVQTRLEASGSLLHSWRNDTPGAPGLLEDHAEMARAALAMYQVTGERQYLLNAEVWMSVIEANFLDPDQGGYFQSPTGRDDLVARMKPSADNATPSGNGTMAENLSRLAHLTGKPEYRERFENLVRAFAGVPDSHMASMGRFLDAVRRDRTGKQVVVMVGKNADAADAMRACVLSHCGFDAIVLVLQDGHPLPVGHPAAGKTAVDGQTTAYVCESMICSAPVTEIPDLARLLGAADD